MAPEIWDHRVCPASDQYGLAVTYAELRMGQPLFKGTNLSEVELNHRLGAVDLVALSEEEQAVLRRALAREPADRFASCTEFVAALEHALHPEVTHVLSASSIPPEGGAGTLRPPSSGTTPVLRPAPGWQAAPAGGGRGRVLVLALLLALAAGAGWAGFAWWQSSHKGGGSEEAAVTVPAGCTPVGDGTAVDVECGRFYRRIAYQPASGPALEFVLVPKGRKGQPDTFYIMKDKVSVREFRAFAEAHPEWVKYKKEWTELPDDCPALPVRGDDAFRFATKWVRGGNLPTLEQWDKAAGRYEPNRREGPHRGKWRELPKDAVAFGRGNPLPRGKASHDESPFGCRDMAGNGEEWTRTTRDKSLLRESMLAAGPATDLSVYLRGNPYDAKTPLLFADLDRENTPSSLDVRDNPPEGVQVGFRLVIEP
jgi:formylglycine-generating enzyme required for sulfatase activity